MPESVYVFKVALSGSKDIWRRIAMRPAQTLDDLHEAIFTAFDRYDEHLYSFFFPKRRTTSTRAIYDSPEYTHPDAAEEPDPFSDKPVGNAARTKLSALGLVAHRKFVYLFDFGDEWWHDITVEQTAAPCKPGKYPRVLEKHGDSPPQYPDIE
ncbi:MAG: plasmid pRiA4b ORF-3 family protein [Planctomycetota bacterium]|nr:plasmid pRiA4b ORF-3 family protein [Planctomycetota bacterium]